MIKRTAEVRDKLLRDFAGGSQCAADFCRSHGINEQTFSYWRKRQAVLDDSISPTPSLLFRQIRAEPDSIPTPSTLILDMGRVRIAIDPDFDPALLRRVVEALS